MGLLDYEYTTDDLPVGQGFDLIPPGVYQACIFEAVVKATNSGTGQYINVGYELLTEGFAGRKVWNMLNVRNDSAKAQEIGLQQLGDLLRACGLPKIQDTDQLLGHNVEIKIGIQPAKDQYEAKNNVKGVKAIEGSQPPSAAPKSYAPPAKRPF